jgi:hypothetical protein
VCDAFATATWERFESSVQRSGGSNEKAGCASWRVARRRWLLGTPHVAPQGASASLNVKRPLVALRTFALHYTEVTPDCEAVRFDGAMLNACKVVVDS